MAGVSSGMKRFFGRPKGPGNQSTDSTSKATKEESSRDARRPSLDSYPKQMTDSQGPTVGPAGSSRYMTGHDVPVMSSPGSGGGVESASVLWAPSAPPREDAGFDVGPEVSNGGQAAEGGAVDLQGTDDHDAALADALKASLEPQVSEPEAQAIALALAVSERDVSPMSESESFDAAVVASSLDVRPLSEADAIALAMTVSRTDVSPMSEEDAIAAAVAESLKPDPYGFAL